MPVIDDLRSAVRTITRSRAISLIVIILVALGVGITTASFALVERVVLRKLPLPYAEQLVNVIARSGSDEMPLPRSAYERLRNRFRSAEQMFAWSGTIVEVNARGASSAASVLYVDGPYYDVLRGRAQLGRLLTPQDSGRVAVVSDGFWRRYLGASQSAIESTIRAGQVTLTVIGVTDPAFVNIGRDWTPDVVVPLPVGFQIESVSTERQQRYYLEVTAVLKSDTSQAHAQAELNALWPVILSDTVPPGQNFEDWRARSGSSVTLAAGSHGRQWSSDDLPRALLIVFAMSALILITVWANIAGLFVARGMRRQKDFAIRLAIGAGHFRIIRESLYESLVLSTCGAALAIVFAYWIATAGIHLFPIPGKTDLRIALNTKVLAFATIASLLTAAVGSLGPALRALNVSVTDVLKSTSPLSSSRAVLRRVLLAVQVGAAVVLVTVSALFAQTILRLIAEPVGFQPELLSYFMLAGKAPWSSAGPDYFRALQDGIRRIPGVQSVGLTNTAPMEMPRDFPEPVSPATESSISLAARYCGFPGLFAALGAPVVEGRDFLPQEQDSAILDRDLAAALFPGTSPVGRWINAGPREGRAGKPDRLLVVGVVPAIKIVSRRRPSRSLFVPCVREWKPPQSAYAMTLVIRSSRHLAEIEPEVRKEVDSLGKQFVRRVETASQVIGESMKYERTLAAVSTVFGTASLLLAGVGLYALIAFIVTARYREFGIRMAVGARAADVLLLVFREIAGITAAGVIAGVAASVAAARSVASFLFGVGPIDVRTFAAVLFVIVVVSAVAAYLPGRRAATLDPSRVLRAE